MHTRRGARNDSYNKVGGKTGLPHELSHCLATIIVSPDQSSSTVCPRRNQNPMTLSNNLTPRSRTTDTQPLAMEMAGSRSPTPGKPLTSSPHNKSTKEKSLPVWTLLMTCAEISLLLFENTFNGVIAALFSFLMVTGLLLERLADRRHAWPVIILIQVFALFGVMAIIDCAHKAGSPINSNAWKFLWVSETEKRRAFGSTLDAQNVLVFLTPTFSRALLTSAFLALVAASMARLPPIRVANREWTWRGLFRSLVQGSMALALLSWSVSAGRRYLLLQESVWKEAPSSCWAPPFVSLKRKPNILILTIDSWRADLVGNDSMPQTLQWLQEPKQGLSLVQWQNHDAGAIDSDAGYAALHYSFKGMLDQHLKYMKANPNITSWPLQAIRSNGYQLHKVTPYPYEFCWSIMEGCDLFTRDYDTQNKGVDLSNKPEYWYGGSEQVFADLKELFEKHNGKADQPMLVSADLQELHYPFNYTRRPDMEYNEPSMKQDVLDQLHSGERRITKENKESILQRLRNRVKNASLNLDRD